MRSKRALTLGIGLALVAGAAQADWKKDYDRGLKAIEAGQWAEAEAAFRAALADDPAPNPKKRFQGVVIKPYVPLHYAGVAAWRRGDCATALDYWSHGPTSSVVATLPEMQATKTKGSAECKQKLAAATTPAPAVVSAPPPATPSATPVRPPTTTAPAPVASKPTPPPAAVVATAPKPEPKPPAASSAPAPAALVSAVEAYLAGRYAAVAQFDPVALADGRAKAQGFLLRAASRYTLAQLADGDAAQLDQARRDVRAARSANASLNPDETAFSPRFRAFWRETK